MYELDRENANTLPSFQKSVHSRPYDYATSTKDIACEVRGLYVCKPSCILCLFVRKTMPEYCNNRNSFVGGMCLQDCLKVLLSMPAQPLGWSFGLTPCICAY